MKFIIPVLAVFICTSCINNVIKRKGVPVNVNERPIPYDMPSTAPIPPVKYCFEQKGTGANTAKIELNVAGDSAYGKVNYTLAGNTSGGDFRGVIYGTTLIVNYKFKSDSGMVTEEQKWSLRNDSLFRVDVRQVSDSVFADSLSAAQVFFPGSLHKVPCK